MQAKSGYAPTDNIDILTHIVRACKLPDVERTGQETGIEACRGFRKVQATADQLTGR
jgi:hypothetical protein